MRRPIPRRFEGLPSVVLPGREVPVATDYRSRLLGLSWLDRDEAGAGLLIPHCSSVHTFGMRFALDLYFFDERGDLLGARCDVPPRRLALVCGAKAVLEIPAREGGEFLAARP